MKNVFIHESAYVHHTAYVAEGTKIWINAQIRENVKIGKNCIIGKDTYIDHDVIIGDGVKIQNGVSVYSGVTIENDVFVGPYVAFTNDLYPRAFNQDWQISKTLIKKGSSIGANATIVCGNTLGEYCMIGAGSVVNRSVQANALVVGNPAKVIGYVCECGRKVDEHFFCKNCGKTLNIKGGFND